MVTAGSLSLVNLRRDSNMPDPTLERIACTASMPELDVEKRGEWYYVVGLTGGYSIGGYTTQALAECYADNMRYLYRLGWEARGREVRQKLGL